MHSHDHHSHFLLGVEVCIWPVNASPSSTLAMMEFLNTQRYEMMTFHEFLLHAVSKGLSEQDAIMEWDNLNARIDSFGRRLVLVGTVFMPRPLEPEEAVNGEDELEGEGNESLESASIEVTDSDGMVETSSDDEVVFTP